MKAVIIEDEILAAKHLQQILAELGNIEIVRIIDTIAEAIRWFGKNQQPDIVFLDIHLADGSAFSIFEHVHIISPIIFTTAYDDYAVKAFKVNSIDYLLKPIIKEDVEIALSKLERLKGPSTVHADIQQLIASITKVKTFKTHFLVPLKGSKLIPLRSKDIAYFHIEDGLVKAKTNEGKSFCFEFTLDELAGMLNPNDFYRANRQYIISRDSIREIDYYFNSRLMIILKVPVSDPILISKVRVTKFQEWYTGV